jgi:hydrogenase expression/formation protein HypC
VCLALPGKIIEIDAREPEFPKARVVFDKVERLIDLSLLPEAKCGQYVIVHVGFAISLLDEEDAKRRMDLLKQALDLENSEVNKPDLR